MKRILLIGLAILAAASCKKVTPEERVVAVAEYFTQLEDTYTSQIAGYEGPKRIDYLTLVLNKDLKIEDIWTLDSETGSSLLATFEGRDKEAKDKPIVSMIAAPVDDPTACGAVLDILKAFKKLKIAHKSEIRVLFYDAQQDSTGRPAGLALLEQDLNESDELISFAIALSTRDTLPERTFAIDDQRRFREKVREILPPYFTPLGSYNFVDGTFPNPEWPFKMGVYRYCIVPDHLPQDEAAVTVFTMLLN